MKRIIIVVSILALCFTASSCTPDDICGEVTGWDIDHNGDYIVYVNGVKNKVIASTFYDAEVGQYLCITY